MREIERCVISVSILAAAVRHPALASAPGANVARGARDAYLRPSQIYRWRRDLERDAASGMLAEPGFAPLPIHATGVFSRRIEGGVVFEVGGAVVRIRGRTHMRRGMHGWLCRCSGDLIKILWYNGIGAVALRQAA